MSIEIRAEDRQSSEGAQYSYFLCAYCAPSELGGCACHVIYKHLAALRPGKLQLRARLLARVIVRDVGSSPSGK